jgi:hypothetical protein
MIKMQAAHAQDIGQMPVFTQNEVFFHQLKCVILQD